MKMTYKILWIDDNIEDIIALGIKDDIQGHLENLEFVTTIDCFATSQLAEEKIQSTKYDLIISDFNIENGGDKGDVLIRKVRSFDIFTEVLFYSAQADFNQTTVGIDRISYFSLEGDEGYQGFKAKVINLIDQTVYKLQELASIRGLVMTETSVLDAMVEKILLDYFAIENEETNSVKEAILKKVEDSLKSNFNANGLKLRQKTTPDIIKSRIFDASKKARVIGHLIELKGLQSQELFKDFFDNYCQEVIEVRNKLAHAKSDIIDEVECLIVDGSEPEKYDLDKCKSIRRNLRKYSGILSELQTHLTPPPQ